MRPMWDGSVWPDGGESECVKCLVDPALSDASVSGRMAADAGWQGWGL
jgi:hypothetical protein